MFGISFTTKLDPNRRSHSVGEFENALRRKIVGQDQAIESLVGIYQTFLAGLNPPRRPVGSLLFLGPTGTGKTRVIEAMAEALFGDASACLKIDCAEFQHSHEIAKLIGSPPGYLGHRETPATLSQEAVNRWHTDKLKLSIVLFDEIEKASDALWQLLLGILDKAVLSLGDNRKVDLSRCIIVMTSNLGSREMSKLAEGGLGFVGKPNLLAAGFDKKVDHAAIEAARRRFAPEFMNRIDKVVVFKALRPEDLQKILDLELGMVQRRILAAEGAPNFVFQCSAAVRELLLEEGTDGRYGARHLKRAIEKNLVVPLANLVATGQVELGDFIRVDLGEEREMTFVKDPRAVVPEFVLEGFAAQPAIPAMAAQTTNSLRSKVVRWPI